MLKYDKTYIGLQEVPGEVSLVIDISNCPFKCPYCNTRHLRKDIGEILDEESLTVLLDSFIDEFTCVVFNGGDIAPNEVNELAAFIKKYYPDVKVAWYSGDTAPTIFFQYHNFDYLKIGPYKKDLGGLKSPTTNQRMYEIDGYNLRNITHKFWEQ